MNSILALNGIKKVYNKTVIIPDLSLSVRQGQFVSLLGPSGCGKTTLLRLIAGLEEPDAGTIVLNGAVVAGEKDFIPPERRRLGMVFQSYAIWPHMNVFDNIAFPLKIMKQDKAAIAAKVMAILGTLKMVGLERRMPHELSGGQQQRVALGRALVMDPIMLLLDEPLSNLDAKLRIEMRAEMRGLQRRYNTTIVYVTHDQSEAFDLSNHVVMMNHGTIEQEGTPHEIKTNPKTEFVRSFLS